MFHEKILAVLVIFISLSIQQASAVPLLNCPSSDPAIIGAQSILATASPNLLSLSKEVIQEHQRIFTLADGTQLSGLYFKSESSSTSTPLILANFGLFTDENAAPISFFVKSLVLNHKLRADVLVVSSVTSARFYTLNHEVGIGGYDEGRILVEITDQLRSEELQTRPTFLFGVSLGGNAVIQALAEDERSHSHRFTGAITFSAVLDEEESSQSLMTSFGHPLEGLKPSHLGLSGKIIADSLLFSMNANLVRENPETESILFGKAGDFFYDGFQKRLKRLEKSETPDWNPEVSRTSVESYIHSSSQLKDSLKFISTPLIVIHAKNDPVVPFSQFREFESRQ